MNTNQPFDYLLELEQRTLKFTSELPKLDRVENTWVGVGFRVGDSRLIAAMSDVKEILDIPEYTMVPGVKSWVAGVANVRGSLLPILDMKSYLLGGDMRQRKRGRVIVIDYKGFNTGLIV
ncbi:MAG: chemotaxis protein CheW, partial [Gammaproteobacteria bacterium]|nr:chemotaxis protein CheW [Gammaproteobacteria bacterium]